MNWKAAAAFITMCAAGMVCGCAPDDRATGNPEVVGWWHFDEGSGQTAADSSGTEWDLTLGEDATVETADPMWTTDGRLGGGLAFTSADGDRLKGALPASSFLATQEITVEFWIKTSSISYSHPILTGNDVFQVQLSNGGFISAVVGDGSTFSSEVWAATAINDGQWHYIAIVFDAALNGGTLSIYIDGTLDVSDDALGVGLADPDFFYIGGNPTHTFVNGVMDEVRVSNNARSASEIAANY